MKANKVYTGKTGELIVCFKGAHYISPSDTVVNSKMRVPVVEGESPYTVVVNANEVWTLKGTYVVSSAGPKVPKTPKTPKEKKEKVAEPTRAFFPNPKEALSCVTDAQHSQVLEQIYALELRQFDTETLVSCWESWVMNPRLGLWGALPDLNDSDRERVGVLAEKIIAQYRPVAGN